MMRFDGEIPPRIWSLKSFKIFSIKCLCYCVNGKQQFKIIRGFVSTFSSILCLLPPRFVFSFSKFFFLINFFQLPPLFNGHHSLFWSLKMALLLHNKLYIVLYWQVLQYQIFSSFLYLPYSQLSLYFQVFSRIFYFMKFRYISFKNILEQTWVCLTMPI